MTLPDAVRTFIGDGSVFDDAATPDRVNPIDLLTDADARAVDVLQAYGVLYSDREAGEESAEAAIEQLATSYSDAYPLDRIRTALEVAGQVPWDETGAEHVTDLVQWYAWPHMRAAYYLGLSIGWRVAQQFGGVR